MIKKGQFQMKGAMFLDAKVFSLDKPVQLTHEISLTGF